MTDCLKAVQRVPMPQKPAELSLSAGRAGSGSVAEEEERCVTLPGERRGAALGRLRSTDGPHPEPDAGPQPSEPSQGESAALRRQRAERARTCRITPKGSRHPPGKPGELGGAERR
jgi:hypothetical protein